MTGAGKSIFYFGFWVLLCGVALMFFPGFVLGLMDITMSSDIVARILGMVLIFLAIYYFLAGRHPEFRPFYRISIYTRASALIITAIFAITGAADYSIILFTIVDAFGSLWTALALRKDRVDSKCN